MESGDLSDSDETDKVPRVAAPAQRRPIVRAPATARPPARVAPRPALPFNAPKLEIPPLIVPSPARIPSATIPPTKTVLPVPARARPSPVRANVDLEAAVAAYDPAPRVFGQSMLRARKSRAKVFVAIALVLAGLATAWLLLRDDAKSPKPAPAQKAH
jgi:hypothetical protein